MRIVVFGASGNVGRLVVAEALKRGHDVRAFVHTGTTLIEQPGLSIIQGDVHDVEAVTRAVQGREAVISTLGSWHTPTKDILTSAMTHIIPAMEAAGIDRIITLTGGGAYAPDEQPSLSYRMGHGLFNILAGKIIRDGEEHMRLLHNSGLNWTTLRAPVMSSQHLAAYKLTMRAPALWQTVPRRAVAQAIVDQLDGAAYERQAPYISR